MPISPRPAPRRNAGCWWLVLGSVPRPDPAMFSMQGPRQTLNHLINYFQQMEINGLQQVLSCYELCPCKAKYCKLQRGRAAPAHSPTVDTGPATSWGRQVIGSALQFWQQSTSILTLPFAPFRDCSLLLSRDTLCSAIISSKGEDDKSKPYTNYLTLSQGCVDAFSKYWLGKLENPSNW